MERALYELLFTDKQNNKLLTYFLYISSVFFLCIPSYILYLAFKDSENTEDELIKKHIKNCLNYTLSFSIYLGISLVLSLFVIGLYILPYILIAYPVFLVISIVNLIEHKYYSLPFKIKFIK